MSDLIKQQKNKERCKKYYQAHRKELAEKRRLAKEEGCYLGRKPSRKYPYMDDCEIVRAYRTALNPKKQIQILAELNDVAVIKILDVLKRNNIDYRKGTS